jgi:hypothetical protein
MVKADTWHQTVFVELQRYCRPSPDCGATDETNWQETAVKIHIHLFLLLIA